MGQKGAPRDDKVEPKKDYDEEGDFEVDAADYSVGNHGRTHGTGSNLVHGNVDDVSSRLSEAHGEIS